MHDYIKFNEKCNNAKKLDDDSTPDKAAVMKVMTRNIVERELRHFIQESVNECFDNIESGKSIYIKFKVFLLF